MAKKKEVITETIKTTVTDEALADKQKVEETKANDNVYLQTLSNKELLEYYEIVKELLSFTEKSIQMNRGSYGYGVQMLNEDLKRNSNFNKYQEILTAIYKEMHNRLLKINI